MDARWTRRRLAPAVAAAFLLAGLAVYVAAFHTAQGRWLDDAARDGFRGLSGPRTEPLALQLASAFDPLPFAGMTLVVAAIAVARRRLRAAVVVPLAMVAANVATQAIKAIVGPVDGAPAAAFPSGHTTAAASAVFGLVLVLPPRLRPFAAAAGGLLVAATAYAIVLVGWHFPSDVAGALCVAGAAAALAVAALPPPATTAVTVRHALLAPAVAAVLAWLAVAALVLGRPDAALQFARGHTAAVVAGAALGAAALAVTTVPALRRR